jgi:hypothetical protein
MSLTPNRAWPYPGPNDVPDVPYWVQRLAEKGEAEAAKAAADLLATNNALKAERYVEFTSGSSTAPANTPWGPGTFTIATTPAPRNNDFAIADAGDCVCITKPGVYLAQVSGLGTAPVPAGSWAKLTDAAEGVILSEQNISATGGASWNFSGMAVFVISAADVGSKKAGAINTGYLLRVRVKTGSAYTFTTNLRLTKLQGA